MTVLNVYTDVNIIITVITTFLILYLKLKFKKFGIIEFLLLFSINILTADLSKVYLDALCIFLLILFTVKIIFNHIKHIGRSIKQVYIFIGLCIITFLASIFVISGFTKVYIKKDYTENHKKISIFINNINQMIRKSNIELKLFDFNLINKYIEVRSKDNFDILTKELIRFKDITDASVIYTMDLKGDVIASTNYDQKDSFLGSNFSYRPYFINASQGKDFHYFAVGKVSGLRGLYVSIPVYKEDTVTGVLVWKINLANFNHELYDKMYMVHKTGLIFMSKNENENLKILHPLDKKTVSYINESSQLNVKDYIPLYPRRFYNKEIYQIRKRHYIALIEKISDDFYVLLLYRPITLISQRVFFETLIFFILFLVLGIITYYDKIRYFLFSEVAIKSRFNELLDFSEIGIVEVDRHFRIKYSNRWFNAKITNNIANNIGADFLSFFDEENSNKIRNLLQKLLISPESNFNYVNLIDINENIRSCWINYSFVVQDDPDAGFRFVILDLDNYMIDLENINDKAADIFNFLPISRIRLDINYNILSIDEELLHVLGISKDSMPVKIDEILLNSSMKELRGIKVDRGFSFYFKDEYYDNLVKSYVVKNRDFKNNIVIDIICYINEVNSCLKSECFYEYFEQMPFCSIITDSNWKVRKINQKYLEITGFRDHYFINNSLKLKNLGLEEYTYEDLYQDISASGVWEGESLIQKNDSSYFYGYMIIFPVFDEKGELLDICIIIQDITKKKEIEVALRRFKEEAEKNSSAKTNFLSAISHELRTPLNSVIGMGTLLEETSLSDTQGGYLKRLNGSAKKMLSIINNIQDINQIESSSLSFTKIKINFRENMQFIIDLFQDKVSYKDLLLKLNIEERVPDVLICDIEKIRQVLINLLENAIFNTLRGKVEVRVRLVTEDEYEWLLRFEVEDTGKGIAEEDIADLFSVKLGENENISDADSSNGFSLVLCKDLIKLLGGRIWVQSELGKGSMFIFELPIEKNAKESEIFENKEIILNNAELKEKLINRTEKIKEKYITNNDLSDKRVLVVDDTEENIFLVKTYLKKMNIPFDIAENGKIAFDFFKKNKYDLILMDIQMPVWDGYKAINEIRKYEEQNDLEKVYITALTAFAVKEEVEKIMKYGYDDYMSKPIIKKEFIIYIKNFFNREK